MEILYMDADVIVCISIAPFCVSALFRSDVSLILHEDFVIEPLV